jgi:hypothetical protein
LDAHISPIDTLLPIRWGILANIAIVSATLVGFPFEWFSESIDPQRFQRLG